jgi:hypothetical protein
MKKNAFYLGNFYGKIEGAVPFQMTKTVPLLKWERVQSSIVTGEK